MLLITPMGENELSYDCTSFDILTLSRLLRSKEVLVLQKIFFNLWKNFQYITCYNSLLKTVPLSYLWKKLNHPMIINILKLSYGHFKVDEVKGGWILRFWPIFFLFLLCKNCSYPKKCKVDTKIHTLECTHECQWPKLHFSQSAVAEQ